MTDAENGADHWAAIHQRLAELDKRLDAGFTPDAATLEARLLERTQQWAAVSEAEQPDSWLEVLTFSLSGETYAVESEHITLVMPLTHYTPLPGTRPHVLGIVNVRGRIVSVLDLRVLFELPIGGLSDKNFLAVLQGSEMEFGLLIDRVLGIRKIQKAALQKEVANLSGIRSAYLLGVTADQWTVLDGARLLGDPDMRVIIE
ncbi:chemotaxis protein CheW [Pseudomonas sp. Q2-TVG4-2]|uniref:chemotaxis protein CheW n=1 Tax=Pseudomonas sp. Q2-TVG4-2 TaxID=1685699 RepID=UPI0015E7B225|nr:chemotaxis protein CheW [Pseudomonas sp. Q2-TVG4-2]